jgi:hypothetical protein
VLPELHEMNIQLYFFMKPNSHEVKTKTIWLPLPWHPHSAPPLSVPSFSKQAADLPEVASI